MENRTARILLSTHAWAMVLLLVSVLLSACSSVLTKEKTASAIAMKAGNTAVSMLGKPYRYGGEGPKGFDCSGLVYYSFSRAGMQVPRSSEAQRKATRPVPLNHLLRGDLLFFDQNGRPSSHVAIYVGDGSFVHAPSSGKRVRIDYLHDAYWKKHFVDARRFMGT